MSRERIRNVWLKKRFAAMTCLDLSRCRYFNRRVIRYVGLAAIFDDNINDDLSETFNYLAAYYLIKKNLIISNTIAIHVPIERVRIIRLKIIILLY